MIKEGIIGYLDAGIVVVLHLGVTLWVIAPFLYFMTAGAKIFTAPELRDGGAQLGQLSFVASMMCVLTFGFFQSLLWYQALCGALLALCSFYLSYMVAFLSAAVAFPSSPTTVVSIACIGLFVYMAFDDERVLLRSELAADYQTYRKRVGMFLPRLSA